MLYIYIYIYTLEKDIENEHVAGLINSRVEEARHREHATSASFQPARQTSAFAHIHAQNYLSKGI